MVSSVRVLVSIVELNFESGILVVLELLLFFVLDGLLIFGLFGIWFLGRMNYFVIRYVNVEGVELRDCFRLKRLNLFCVVG